MNVYVVELLDARGNLVEMWMTTAVENLEGLILGAAETCGAFDDERFDGDGGMVEGSIRWRAE